MKYWTAFNIGDKSTYGYLYQLCGVARQTDLLKEGVEPEELSDTGHRGVGVVLLEPTEAELSALHNAVVINLSEVGQHEKNTGYFHAAYHGLLDNLYLCIRPQDIDGYGKVLRTRGYSAWRGGVAIPAECVTIIVDGHHTINFCGSCSKVINRAAGKCVPPLEGCSTDFFSAEARIMLPPMEMYMPLKECAEYTAFKPRTYKDMSPDVAPGSPIVRDTDNSSAVAAGRTRSLRTTFCKYCALNCADGNVEYCAGPILSTEFPEPTLTQRIALRLGGYGLPLEIFDELNEECFGRVGFRPKWRKDPELRLGCLDKAAVCCYDSRNSVTDDFGFEGMLVYQNRVPHPMVWAFPFSKLCDVLATHNYDVTFADEMNTPAGSFEKALCWAVDDGVKTAICHGGWGSSGKLVGLEFRGDASPNSGSAHLCYHFKTLGRLKWVYTIADLATQFYKMSSAGDIVLSNGYTIEVRAEKLMKAFNDKSTRPAVKKYMKAAAKAATDNRAIPQF